MVNVFDYIRERIIDIVQFIYIDYAGVVIKIVRKRFSRNELTAFWMWRLFCFFIECNAGLPVGLKEERIRNWPKFDIIKHRDKKDKKHRNSN